MKRSIIVTDLTRFSRTTPHMEDCRHQSLVFGGTCSGEEFRRVLVRSCFPSLEAGFEISLPHGEKVISAGLKVPRSRDELLAEALASQEQHVAYIDEKQAALTLKEDSP